MLKKITLCVILIPTALYVEQGFSYCIIYSYEIHITTTTTTKVAHPTAIRDTTIHLISTKKKLAH